MKRVFGILVLAAFIAATVMTASVLTTATLSVNPTQEARATMRPMLMDNTKLDIMNPIALTGENGYQSRHAAINYRFDKRSLRIEEAAKNRIKTLMIK